jgi:hypothetical protein
MEMLSLLVLLALCRSSRVVGRCVADALGWRGRGGGLRGSRRRGRGGSWCRR